MVVGRRMVRGRGGSWAEALRLGPLQLTNAAGSELAGTWEGSATQCAASGFRSAPPLAPADIFPADSHSRSRFRAAVRSLPSAAMLRR